MPYKKPSEILLDKIRALGVPLGPNTIIRSTRAGRHERAAGACSWFVWHADICGDVIGYDHVTDLAQCPNLRITGSAKFYYPREVYCGCHALEGCNAKKRIA